MLQNQCYSSEARSWSHKSSDSMMLRSRSSPVCQLVSVMIYSLTVQRDWWSLWQSGSQGLGFSCWSYGLGKEGGREGQTQSAWTVIAFVFSLFMCSVCVFLCLYVYVYAWALHHLSIDESHYHDSRSGSNMAARRRSPSHSVAIKLQLLTWVLKATAQRSLIGEFVGHY